MSAPLMCYPTNPLQVARLNDDDFEALLLSVWNAPLPRRVVRIHAARRDQITAMMEGGMTRVDVAKHLNLTPSMISKILTGARN